MRPDVRTLLDRLQAGEDTDELYLELLPPGERELLRRLALVRQFDEPLVDEVLQPGVAGGSRDEVPFARLVRDAAVQRWPRTAASYFMHPSARRARLPDTARAARRGGASKPRSPATGNGARPRSSTSTTSWPSTSLQREIASARCTRRPTSASTCRAATT